MNDEIAKLKVKLSKTKDLKQYRSMLAKIAGMSGTGKKKRAAAIKASKARWAK